MTLSVGFLGYGFMGKAHANALARLPMFFPETPAIEREILIGSDEERLATARDRLGFNRLSTDWRDALEGIDVLCNLGPNHLHAEPSIAALEAGVHVLCEKPLATTQNESEQMAAVAAESAATAGVAFNYRFLPAVQVAKERIEAGDLGEIHHAHVRYYQDWLADPKTPWSWRLDADRAGSGALGDLGSHAIDIVRYLCRSKVGKIASVVGNLQTITDERPDPDDPDTTLPVTVDDACNATLQFESGATGFLETTRCASGHKNDLEVVIHGSKGSLKFSLERLNELQIKHEETRGYETILVTDESDPYIDHWWPPGHVLGWEHAFVHEHHEFLTAIDNANQFQPDFLTGHEVQLILNALEESAQTNTPVPLQPHK